MDVRKHYEFILIRDNAVLVRKEKGLFPEDPDFTADLFDVRTGSPMREIHPPVSAHDLDRGRPISRESASVIIKSGTATWIGPDVDISKVVNILDIRQRRLDAIVADSILDQLGVITELLQGFVEVAATSSGERRLWISQHILPIIRKFSGRELEELQETLEWLRRHPD